MASNGRRMRTIGVLFGMKPAWVKQKYPKYWKKTRKSFILLQKIAEKKGINVVIGIIKDYKNKKFRISYRYRGNKFIVLKNQKIDIIFDRSWNNQKREKLKTNLQKEIPFFNNSKLNQICWDKYVCSKILKKHMLKAYLVHNKNKLKKILKNIKTEKVVLKPRLGIMGKNVIITKKHKIPKKIPKNTIAQEFVDSSDGIKELGIKGVHDLRVVILSGKIDHVYVRKPKKGLVANIAQGGLVFHITKKLPKEVLGIVKDIDKKMKKYGPRLYTVDIIFNEKQKPIVTELESTPVIDSAYKSHKAKPIQKRFISNIIDNILKLK